MKKAIYTLMLFGCVLMVASMWPPTSGKAAPGSVVYRYDSLGRLVQDVYPANSASYSYDAAGNRSASSVN